MSDICYYVSWEFQISFWRVSGGPRLFKEFQEGFESICFGLRGSPWNLHECCCNLQSPLEHPWNASETSRNPLKFETCNIPGAILEALETSLTLLKLPGINWNKPATLWNLLEYPWNLLHTPERLLKSTETFLECPWNHLEHSWNLLKSSNFLNTPWIASEIPWNSWNALGISPKQTHWKPFRYL